MLRASGATCRRIALYLALIPAACALPPPAPPPADTAPHSAQVRVEDEHGPLGAAGATAAVRRLDGDDERGLLARHLAEVEKVIALPLVVGNDAHLLIDGPQTQQAMLQAISEAQHSIDLETYILEWEGIGERLAALLEAKHTERVAVRVLYDSIGSLGTPVSYFDRLLAAGVVVCAFNPVVRHRLDEDRRLGINNRDHRKILIVDDRIAFTGGINISTVYSASSFGPKLQAPSRQSGWRDTDVVVRGPVVGQFQALFDQNWGSQDCPAEKARHPQPLPARAGNIAMRLVAADPAAERRELYVALLSAIEHARRRVWLTYGYFVPDQRTLQSLQDAAARGVDVRLVLPGFSDFWAPFQAGRSHYGSLLGAGVRIFERRDALLHAKTAVIDGVWSSVGSTNLDWRSFVHNYEADLLVLDSGFAGELERLFELDESMSREIKKKGVGATRHRQPIAGMAGPPLGV